MEDIGDFVVLKQLVTFVHKYLEKKYTYIYFYCTYPVFVQLFKRKKCQLTWISKVKEVGTATERGIVLPKIIAFAIMKWNKIHQENNVDAVSKHRANPTGIYPFC